MANRLSTQAQIKRLRAAGFSRKDIARATGSSVSAVGRAERGQTSGATIAAPVREFFGLGKRARANVASGAIPLPSAKPVAAKRGRGARTAVEKALISPLMRAEGQLSIQDRDAMVVVQVTLKGTGKSRTLFAHGGVWRGQIKGDLRGAISAQYGRQYDGQGLDWADIVDITIEEY